MSTAYCPNPDPRTLLCFGCGRLCEPRSNGWQHARPRCGNVGPRGRAPCARWAGHRGRHEDAISVDLRNKRFRERNAARAAA